MAEFLIAPKTTPASTHAAARDNNESRLKEPGRADTDGDKPASFATALKSANERNRPESAKETSTEAKPPATAATKPASAEPPPPASAPAGAPISAEDLLSLLEIDPATVTDASLANLQQADPLNLAAVEADAAPESLAPADPLNLALAAPSPLLATPPANPSAVSPAPTFAGSGARGAAANNSEIRPDFPASFASERSAAADKLAADTAFSAASLKAGAGATNGEASEGEFRAVMDRVANTPANMMMQNGGAAAPAAQAGSLRVETPLGQAGWRDEMGQKLTWMVSNQKQQAELVLNPPQLGRIEVTLTLDGDHASVSFVSPHAAVRETLENSLTRLREILADAGVTLGQTSVGAESRQDSDSMHRKDGGLAAGRMDGERNQSEAIIALNSGFAPRHAYGRGMVDVFA